MATVKLHTMKKSESLPGRIGTSSSQPAVQLARQKYEQKQKDIQEGARFNEELKNPAHRRDPWLLSQFWLEFKTRVQRKFGSIHAGMRSFDAAGDGATNLVQFSEILRSLHLSLDSPIARAVFEKASRGERTLNLEDLKVILMQSAMQKMRSVMERFNLKQSRVQSHIQAFIKRVSLANEACCERALDRFHRKLTVDVLREIWSELDKLIGRPPSRDAPIDRHIVEKCVFSMVGTQFQAYEIDFMLRIYDRIAGRRKDGVTMFVFIVTLVLLSPELDRVKKVSLLFDVYDTDADGCLLYDQILAMIRCICTQRSIVEESALESRPSGPEFEEELIAQEALRAFESTFFFLRQMNRHDSDVVTVTELWEALAKQGDMVMSLFPGTLRIRWAKDSTPAHADDRPHSAASIQSRPGSCSRRQRATLRAISTQVRGSDNPSMQSKASRFSIPSRYSLGTPSFPAMASFEGLAQTHGEEAFLKPSQSKVSAIKTEAFQKTMTDEFQQYLRNFGGKRLAKIASEFPGVLGTEGKRMGASNGLLEYTQSHDSAHLSHCKSAPAGILDICKLPAAERKRLLLPSTELPPLELAKWGAESADRIRLASSVKLASSKRRCKQLDDRGQDIQFKCFLCQHVHGISVNSCRQ